MDLVYEALEQLWKIMAFENNGTTSRLVDFLCFAQLLQKPSAGLSVTYSTSTTSIESFITLSPSGKLIVILSLFSRSLLSLSAEASTIVMALNSTLQTNPFTKSQIDHISSTMITSPTESYMSDEASNSMDSPALDVDDIVVTSFVDLSQEEEKNRFPWLNVSNLEECDVAERQLEKYIDDVIIAPYGHVKA